MRLDFATESDFVPFVPRTDVRNSKSATPEVEYSRAPDVTDRTLQVWQRRTDRNLGPGDAGEIVSTLSQFLVILSEWDAQDRARDGLSSITGGGPGKA